MTDNILEITDLNKTFRINQEDIPVLKNINLTIRTGEFVCIVGGSGCGKSTLLRIIAGLESKNKGGSICSKNMDITKPSLDRGMIFQESRLFPWLTVAENIAFGIDKNTKKRLNKEQQHQLIMDFLKLVNLESFASAHPKQLSGGMQQRVSIARSLIANPEILLLDEPFGALDAFTKLSMQNELLRIWEHEQATMIMVTHDIEEAVFLADRIVVLSNRPGTLKNIYQIELPRPRERSSVEFVKLRETIYREFC